MPDLRNRTSSSSWYVARRGCAIISDMPYTLREKVRVMMHLPEGYTKVLVERTLGVGMANGGVYWDIPTSAIPPHLRQMGSRFLLETAGLSGKLEAENMSAEEIRSALRLLVVTEIRDESGQLLVNVRA